MKRRAIWLVFAMLSAFILPLGAAAEDPPAPTMRHQSRLDGLPVAGPADVATFIFETQPGARTPPHTHPGLVVGTVIEGELTLVIGGTETSYTVGEVFTEPPGAVAIAHNRGAVRSRVLGSMVIPRDSAPSAAEPGAPPPASPAPATLYFHRTAAVLPAGAYEVAHTVLDFAPGAQTPPHTHPGQVVATVLAGEISFTTGGTTRAYKTGESFIELPGVVGQARNVGSAPATVMGVHLLPRGAPLSMPVAPGMPSTGSGGGAGSLSGPTALGLLALSTGALLAAGWLVRRREVRRR